MNEADVTSLVSQIHMLIVCLSTCLPVCVCSFHHVCMCGGGKRSILAVPQDDHLACSLIGTWDSIITGWLVSTSYHPVSVFPVLRLQIQVTTPGFICGFRDLTWLFILVCPPFYGLRYFFSPSFFLIAFFNFG